MTLFSLLFALSGVSVEAAQPNPLAHFHQALARLKSDKRPRPVTILHLGDSHIAADRITRELRQQFQQRFGNAGRGLIQPGLPYAGYRAKGVSIEQRGPWTVANSVRNDPGPYGLSGIRLTANDPQALLRYRSEDRFDRVELVFAASPEAGRAVLELAGRRQELDTAGLGGERRYSLAIAGRELQLSPLDQRPISLLSVAFFTNRPGVRYINLGIPSARADVIQRWDPAQMARDLKALAPDLVLLGYGVNEGFKDDLQAEAYRRGYEALIQFIRRTVPTADVAVIGAPDGARLPRAKLEAGVPELVLDKESCRPLNPQERLRYDPINDPQLLRWHPPPNLQRVRAIQADVARQLGLWFWDWSQLMGGDCGIHRWATAMPPLALPDHVHLTDAGSAQTAHRLYAALMKGFGK